MAEQMGDGGLSVGAGDAHPGDVLQRVPGHSHLSIHGDAVLAQLLDRWVVPGDPWADHHPLHVIQPGAKAVDGKRGLQSHLNPLFSQ